LGKILSSPDDNNIFVAWDFNIFLNNWGNWHLVVVMLMVMLSLYLFSVSWEHMSIILFIILFLAWDILNKMVFLLRSLLLSIIWVMWVHFFIVFLFIFLRGGVGLGVGLRLGETTMSIELSHFVGIMMMLWWLFDNLVLRVLVTHDLF
jgi:hypothetical protein|tara:strand:+ start:369 stop:812 length:444 start_codon:yes stop_codon:yes gene_type:complete